MKTIGFFNNKGGVGKTSLVYHVAWMLAELNVRVVAADLDPQSNLTSLFLSEDRLGELLQKTPRSTLHGAVSPQFRGVGDVQPPTLEAIAEGIALLAGDLKLSGLEDDLALSWPKCLDGDERSFRVISAFARAIGMAAEQFGAEFGLVDVGPNLGPLNRAALLACDYVVVPLGADLLSLQGLSNMGPRLRDWRSDWRSRLAKNPEPNLLLPNGSMRPLGYVVMRHSVSAGRPARAYSKWIDRIPERYRNDVLDIPAGIDAGADTIVSDDNRLAVLKDYRSLMPLAQEARKPMFLLRAGDGAFGGHQKAVELCYADFKALTTTIVNRARQT